jgi:hypothetical protein
MQGQLVTLPNGAPAISAAWSIEKSYDQITGHVTGNTVSVATSPCTLHMGDCKHVSGLILDVYLRVHQYSEHYYFEEHVTRVSMGNCKKISGNAIGSLSYAIVQATQKEISDWHLNEIKTGAMRLLEKNPEDNRALQVLQTLGWMNV